MENRFKFRVWDKAMGRMGEVEKIEFALGNNPTQIVAHYGNGDKWGDSPDNLILMQCTGLKDKNGTLIFEGDVLIHDFDEENPEPVVWDKDGFYVGLKGKEDGCPLASHINHRFFTINGVYENNTVIIGNIHANPESMKGE